MSEVKATKVITGRVRASYAKVYKPEAMEEGQEPKYSCSFLIDKSDKTTLDKIAKAIEAAKKEGAAKFGDAWLKGALHNPLRDGDEKEGKEYVGKMFINAKSKTKPGIILPNKMPIDDEAQFYSGCECLAAITFFAYKSSASKGIGVSLENILSYNKGENLGGGKAAAEDDFAAIAAEDYTDDLL